MVIDQAGLLARHHPLLAPSRISSGYCKGVWLYSSGGCTGIGMTRRTGLPVSPRVEAPVRTREGTPVMEDRQLKRLDG
jgi:hypothetical protein